MLCFFFYLRFSASTCWCLAVCGLFLNNNKFPFIKQKGTRTSRAIQKRSFVLFQQHRNADEDNNSKDRPGCVRKKWWWSRHHLLGTENETFCCSTNIFSASSSSSSSSFSFDASRRWLCNNTFVIDATRNTMDERTHQTTRT